jgi:hypothetical protein
MHQRLLILLGMLPVTAVAQPGMQITMAPNSRQTGRVSFANSCPSAQTFEVAVRPEVDWLRLEPATVDVPANTTFEVHVTINTIADRRPGTRRSTIAMVCASCAASDPPCLQGAADFPVTVTVAGVAMPEAREPPASPPHAVPATPVNPIQSALAAPPPLAAVRPPAAGLPAFVPIVAGALLVAGTVVSLLAIRALTTHRHTHRHRVRQ